MRVVLIIVLLSQFSLAYAIEHFLLPKDGERAEQALISDISHAQHSISVAMFMVTNRKLVQALKDRAEKSNIDIRLIADKSYNMTNPKTSKIRDLLHQKNITVYTLKGLAKKRKNKFGILHAKLLVIDDDIVYIGSTNWTNSAFHSNYEILVKFRDNATAKLYQYYFETLLYNSTKLFDYRGKIFKTLLHTRRGE